MSAIRVLGFDGLIPRMSPTLMGEQFAQIASNVKLYSKELRFWRGPKLAPDTNAPPANYQTIYRLFHSTGATAFLLWTTDVDVAISPGADTTGETRFYYTGDGAPKKSNWALATGGAEPYPAASMPMGVPAPTVAPTLVLKVSGTGLIETRAYVYTIVQTFGGVQVESGPSPPSSIDVPSVGSTVTVSGFGGWPSSGLNITSVRIYRTVIGETTESYQFVHEGPATPFDDDLTVAQLGEVLPTGGWSPPPDNLIGLVALPGGSLAGFVGNTVYFSVPYYPHAWPLAFAITIPVMKIVGLGVLGSSIAVMTGTTPFFIHGGVPGEMYVERVPLQEPCVGKSTIAADEDGIVYASPNGLVLLSAATRGLVTNELFTADEWRPLIPVTMKAAILQGRYFGVFPDESPPRAVIVARNDPPALSFMQLPASALHTDARNGFLFYVDGIDHKVYQVDADAAQPLSYEWKSKRFFVDRAQTFSLLRLDADYDQLGDAASYEAERAEAIAWNTAHYGQDLLGAINAVPIHAWDINGSILHNLPSLATGRTVQVILWGDDGEVRANLQPLNLNPIRIPAFKSRELEVSILGNINVRSLHMATTIEELLAS
jgi:hypothetical protein